MLMFDYDDFIREGKVKYIGLSNPSVNTLRRAHAVHPIAAIEVEFSPLVLETAQPPNDLIQTAKELDIAVVVYSPLARGLITGRFVSAFTIYICDSTAHIEQTSPEQFEPTDYRRGIPR